MADIKKTVGKITYEIMGHDVVVHEGSPPLNEVRIRRHLGRIKNLELGL